MADPLLVLLIVAAVLVIADVLLTGGAMTMGTMTAMSGVVAHPLAAGALVILVIALALVFSGRV